MAGYEDTLFVFLVRLAQLQGRPYGPLAAPAAGGCAVPGPWGGAATDSDATLAYLAVARQFWIRNEPISYRNIARILLCAALQLRDRDVQRRVRALGRAFRQHTRRAVTLSSEGVTVRVPVQTLAELWFNQLYFHADLNSVEEVERLLADEALRTQARAEFMTYLEVLVQYVRQLGAEAAHLVETGVLPKGRLHALIEAERGRAMLRAAEELALRPVTA